MASFRLGGVLWRRVCEHARVQRRVGGVRGHVQHGLRSEGDPGQHLGPAHLQQAGPLSRAGQHLVAHQRGHHGLQGLVARECGPHRVAAGRHVHGAEDAAAVQRGLLDAHGRRGLAADPRPAIPVRFPHCGRHGSDCLVHIGGLGLVQQLQDGLGGQRRLVQHTRVRGRYGQRNHFWQVGGFGLRGRGRPALPVLLVSDPPLVVPGQRLHECILDLPQGDAHGQVAGALQDGLAEELEGTGRVHFHEDLGGAQDGLLRGGVRPPEGGLNVYLVASV
mmetsp:Transcript_10140/g.13933  ORF Transcript_10140/g.13933 Transcript_10140/m.13933 type:complete len:276 (-) Transcript_10140:563-1390(-)